MKSIVSVMVSFILIGMLIVYFLKPLWESAAYDTGYRDARKIYECDHDRAECEVLTENY